MLAVAIHKSILDGHQGENYEETLGAVISKYNLPNLLEEVEKQGIQIETDKDGNTWIYYEPRNIYITVYKDGQFGPKEREDFDSALRAPSEEDRIESVQLSREVEESKPRKWRYIKPKQFSLFMFSALFNPSIVLAVFGKDIFTLLKNPDVLMYNIPGNLPLLILGSTLTTSLIFWVIRYFGYYNFSNSLKRIYVKIFKGARIFNIILGAALVSAIILNIFGLLPESLTINGDFFNFTTGWAIGEVAHHFIYKLTNSSVRIGDDLLQNIFRLVSKDQDFKKPVGGAIGKELRRLDRLNRIDLEKKKRAKETKAKTPDGFIRKGNLAFEQMVSNLSQGNFTDQTDSLKKDIQEIEDRINNTLEVIVGSDQPLRIIATDAVILNIKDDYSLGFYSHAPPVKEELIGLLGSEEAFNKLFPQPTLVLSREVLNNPVSSIRQEYIYHEAICPVRGHYEAIREAQVVFRENYPDIQNNPQGNLQIVLRNVIDTVGQSAKSSITQSTVMSLEDTKTKVAAEQDTVSPIIESPDTSYKIESSTVEVDESERTVIIGGKPLSELTPIFFHRRNLIQRGKIQSGVLEDIYAKIEARKLKPNEIGVVLIEGSKSNEDIIKYRTGEKFGDKVIILNLRNLKGDIEAYFKNIIINPEYRSLLQGEGLRLQDARKYLDKA